MDPQKGAVMVRSGQALVSGAREVLCCGPWREPESSSMWLCPQDAHYGIANMRIKVDIAEQFQQPRPGARAPWARPPGRNSRPGLPRRKGGTAQFSTRIKSYAPI